jgi:hypothetical protein
MTLKKLLWLAGVIVIGGVFLVAMRLHPFEDDEASVYRGLVHHLTQDLPVKDAVLMSSPTTCNSSLHAQAQPPEQLLIALQLANAPPAMGRSAISLSGITGLVAWVDAKSQSGPRRILQVSRVGFDTAHKRAIVCFQDPGGGWLIYFAKSYGMWWYMGAKEAWVR